jgi:transketolase
VLTRQNIPTLDRQVYAPAEGLRKGAYVLADLGEGIPQLILMASGSEVGLIIEVGNRIAEKGTAVRLVSFPSWELFAEQDETYRNAVLSPGIQLRLAVEAGVSQGWHRWVGPQGRIQGLDRYGASAPASQVFENLGFSVAHIEKIAWDLLDQ